MSTLNTKLDKDADDLDSLAFFNLVGDEDTDILSEDPNANIAPDILGDDEDDPINQEAAQKVTTPAAPKAPEIDPQLQVTPATPQTPPAQTTSEPEEEEEEEEDEDRDDLLKGDADPDPGMNLFKEFGTVLTKGGLLNLEEGEDPEKIDWTEETFTEKLESTIENRAFEYIENLALERHGEEGIELIRDILINGVSIPQYLSRYQQQVDLENLDMSDQSNKVAVMKDYLMRTGVDEEEANDRIQFAIDNDKLDDYAGKYHQKLVMVAKKEREQMVERQKAQVEQQQQFERQRRESYQKILAEAVKAGEIEGYPVSNKDATELLNFVDQKAYTLPNGQKLSSFEYKLAKLRHEDPKKFLAFAKLLQADLDLTPVKKRAVTNETNDIFKDLKNKTKRETMREPGKKSSLSNFEKYFLKQK